MLQYPRNPTAPAFNAGLPLAANAKCSIFIDGSTATPKDWVAGGTANLVSVLTRTTPPVAGIDAARNNQGRLTFTTASQAVQFPGRGNNATDVTGSFTLFATFRQTNTGNALVCGTGTAMTDGNQTCAIWVNQTAGNQVIRIRNAGNLSGNIVLTGAAGHQISTAWVFNAGTTTLNWYWYDHDAGTSGSRTTTEPFNPTSSSSGANFYLNPDDNTSGAPTFNFAGDIYQGGNATRAWSQTDFNQYAADYDAFVRPGTFTGAPTAGTINTNLDVALDGSAIPGEVASVFTGMTAGSFAIDQGVGPTTSSIVSVTVTDATHCTVRVAMGTTAGAPLLRAVGSGWQLPLTANAAPVVPTGYTLTPASTPVNSGSPATLTITFTPTGSAFGVDTTFTTHSTGPSTLGFATARILAGNNSGTFAATPPGAGSFTASLTNAAGLPDAAPVAIVATSALALGTPTLGTVNAAGVTLNWPAATGAVGAVNYHVYRLTRPTQSLAAGTDLGTTAGLTYTDTTGPQGRAVWYYLTATDSATPPVTVAAPVLAATRRQPDVDIACLGDSIAGGIVTGTTSGPNGIVAAGGLADELGARYGPAALRTVVVRNYCRGGTSVANWLPASVTPLWPGSSVNLWNTLIGNNSAVIAGAPASTTHFFVHLGLVDVTLAHGAGGALATWGANMQALIGNLQAFRPGAKIWLSLLPWSTPNSGAYASPTAADAGFTADMNDWILGRGAYAGQALADGVTVIAVNRKVYERICNNPATLLDADGLHHSPAAYILDARNVGDDGLEQLDPAPIGAGVGRGARRGIITGGAL